jgi:hypothetical protein
MQIKNVTKTQVENAVWRVNARGYDGNIKVHADADTRYNAKGIPTFQGRISVHSSKGEGAAVSYNGRAKAAACWHVFRDVFADILSNHPTAVIKTALATYTAETFSDVYPETGRINVGSMIEPLDAEDACKCEDSGELVTIEQILDNYTAPQPVEVGELVSSLW